MFCHIRLLSPIDPESLAGPVSIKPKVSVNMGKAVSLSLKVE